MASASHPQTSFRSDTICAVATPAGRSRRAIVRLSGDESLTIAAKLFRPAEGDVPSLPGYSVTTGEAILDGDLSCPAMIYVMRAPRSYTRELVVELHLPGSEPLVRAVLEATIALGARPARPGEFTKRALLGGRLDLSGAEAVLGAVSAASASELRAASSVLTGRRSSAASQLAEAVAQAMGEVEILIDFSDQAAPRDAAPLAARLRSLAGDAAAEADRARSSPTGSGRVRIAMVGAPNAGKSSLFNALLAEDRAVVSGVPGTTTDCVEAESVIKGVPVTLLDTAGIGGEATGEIARLAAAASLRFLGSAQLVLLVVDPSEPDIPSELTAALAGSSATVWQIMSKADVAVNVPAPEWPRAEWSTRLSAVTGVGMERLTGEIAARFGRGELRLGPEGIALGAASAAGMAEAAASLEAAAGHIEAGAEELAAFELRHCAGAIGAVTGEMAPFELADSVLDRLFDRFCVGK